MPKLDVKKVHAYNATPGLQSLKPLALAALKSIVASV